MKITQILVLSLFLAGTTEALKITQRDSDYEDNLAQEQTEMSAKDKWQSVVDTHKQKAAKN